MRSPREYELLLHVARHRPCALDGSDRDLAIRLCRGDDAVLWLSRDGYDVSTAGWAELDRMRCNPHLPQPLRAWIEEVTTGTAIRHGPLGDCTDPTTIDRAVVETGGSKDGARHVDPERVARRQSRRLLPESRVDTQTREGRTCSRCGEFLSWESFAKNKRGRSGRSSVCRACRAAQNNSGGTEL